MIACQRCWVLHRRPWRESSLMVELFSFEHGRLGVMARGARGARSNWRGLCEPFLPLSAQWRRRGELGTLTELEPTQRPVALTGAAIWCGLYANELLLKLLERDEPVAALHQAYDDLMSTLATAVADQHGMALRRFEWALLRTLGVAPELSREAGQGVAIEPDQQYLMDPEAGLQRTANGHQGYSGRAILWLADGARAQVEPELRRQARAMLAQLIDHQLAGRTLKTRELFRTTR